MTILSIVVMEIIGVSLHSAWFVENSQHFVMLINIPLGVAMFLYFASMKPFFNKSVNIIAGTVLGVYLIHENLFLRKIIWNYIFPNLDYITSNWYILFYVVKVVVAFIVCRGIDLLRKRYIEPPMARFIDRYFDVISEYIKIKVNNVIVLLTR